MYFLTKTRRWEIESMYVCMYGNLIKCAIETVSLNNWRTNELYRSTVLYSALCCCCQQRLWLLPSNMRFHNQSLLQGCIVVVLSCIFYFFPFLRSSFVSSRAAEDVLSLYCERFYMLSMPRPATEFGTQIRCRNIHVQLLPFMTVFPSDSASLYNVFASAGYRNCISGVVQPLCLVTAMTAVQPLCLITAVTAVQPHCLVTAMTAVQPHCLVTVMTAGQPHCLVTAMTTVQPHCLVTVMTAGQPLCLVTVMTAVQPHCLVTVMTAGQPLCLVTAMTAVQPLCLMTAMTAVQPHCLVTVMTAVQPHCLVTVMTAGQPLCLVTAMTAV